MWIQLWRWQETKHQVYGFVTNWKFSENEEDDKWWRRLFKLDSSVSKTILEERMKKMSWEFHDLGTQGLEESTMSGWDSNYNFCVVIFTCHYCFIILQWISYVVKNKRRVHLFSSGKSKHFTSDHPFQRCVWNLRQLVNIIKRFLFSLQQSLIQPQTEVWSRQ